MGYVGLFVFAGAVFIVIAVGLKSMARKRQEGDSPANSPIARNDPSADAPTPAKSVVESPGQVEKARQHTPPA